MSVTVLNEKLAAITVTYEPDAGWPERLRIIVSICPHCIVVDNSTTPEARAFVRTTVAGFKKVQLIANPDNFGLGRALNQGCEILYRDGHVWTIAFDQDSIPAPELAAALLSTAKAHHEPVAVVGANWRDMGRPHHASRHLRTAAHFNCCFRRTVATHDLTDVLCVITSGSLFSLRAWNELNGFDEALFLDLVDTDFCLRARQAKWTVNLSARAQLEHKRGSKQPVRLLGRTYYPSFMPPSRLQGLFRNRIFLFHRHGLRERAWVAYELIYVIKILCDILLLENQKFSKLVACFCGTYDGIIGGGTHQTPKPN